jgi:hypothetical protein
MSPSVPALHFISCLCSPLLYTPKYAHILTFSLSPIILGGLIESRVPCMCKVRWLYESADSFVSSLIGFIRLFKFLILAFDTVPNLTSKDHLYLVHLLILNSPLQSPFTPAPLCPLPLSEGSQCSSTYLLFISGLSHSHLHLGYLISPDKVDFRVKGILILSV